MCLAQNRTPGGSGLNIKSKACLLSGLLCCWDIEREAGWLCDDLLQLWASCTPFPNALNLYFTS